MTTRTRIGFSFSVLLASVITLAVVAVLNVSSSTTAVTIILSALVTTVFGVVMATKLARGITRPAQWLAAAVDRVASGDFDPLENLARNEIGEMSRSFSRMVSGLRGMEEDRKRAEAELRESETRSRALLEGSPVCNKIIDLDSRLQYMSAAGHKKLKIADITTLYGCPYPPEFYPEPMRAPLVEHLERAKAGETCSVECPLFDTEGTEVWYHTTFVPARDSEGRIEYIIAASVDITDRKRLEGDLKQASQCPHCAGTTPESR
ncbi:MAG: PAS domain-containing protein [Phycisphaerales bacterium]